VLQFAPRIAAKTKEDIAAIEPEAMPSNFMLEFFYFHSIVLLLFIFVGYRSVSKYWYKVNVSASIEIQ
jgi:hypothetical protein